MRENADVTTATMRAAVLDAVCAAAVDLARGAADEVGTRHVGEYLGAVSEGERLVTHRFATTAPAYVGWHWAVTVARASRARVVSVNDVVLLPGDGALLSPDWVPWSDRLRPGDLGVGDLLPTDDDDDRLVPAYASDEGGDTDPTEEVAWELGLGRVRVLSPLGRLEAAERWYDGDAGPLAPIARSAPAQCGTCGFFVVLAGALRQAFGACANELAPDDGRVVAVDHGCGAHSEGAADAEPDVAPAARFDELGFDIDSLDEPAADEHPPGSVSDNEPAELFGHS